MTQKIQGPSVRRLLQEDLRIPIERCVSTNFGWVWQVVEAEDKTDAASHPAAILSNGADAVFVKFGEGDLAEDQFSQELAGLRLLTERAGVLTPTGIGIVPVKNGALFIMAAVEVVARQPGHWRQMGQTLAQIHQVKGEQFGLDHHCYWGSLYQDNRTLPDWPTFYWTRRIEPRLREAVDTGRLSSSLVAQMEKLGSRLDELCGPPVQPTLLHGDAHQNNFLSTAQGPVLIDPSVYYGHPEIELAYVDFFAPVADEFYTGYQEVTPIAPNFAQRRDLWLIPAWLAMLDLPGHLDKLKVALRNYV
ncbi:MAG: fructosamine kinase family protein [Caldilineaceae bacterium]